MPDKNILKHKDLFPVNLKSLLKGNIYRNVNICSQSAEQIEQARLLQIKEKRNEWADYNQQFNTSFSEDNGLERISKYFEKLEKSTNIAVEKFLAGEFAETSLNLSENKNYEAASTPKMEQNKDYEAAPTSAKNNSYNTDKQ